MWRLINRHHSQLMAGKESRAHFSIPNAPVFMISLLVYTEMSADHPELRLDEKWYYVLSKFSRRDGGRMRILICKLG